MKKVIGDILIVVSVFLAAATLLAGFVVGKGFRKNELRLLQEGFVDGASLARKVSPCCSTLSCRTLPEMSRLVHELQGALKSLGPIADFTVDAADFRIVFLQPFGAYTQAGADFRNAVPVMQNCASQAERELQCIRQIFPEDSGQRLSRISGLLEKAAIAVEWSIRLQVIAVPVILFFGILLSLLTFLNGWFLRSGFPEGEKKDCRR